MAIYGVRPNSRAGAIARQESAAQARQTNIQAKMAEKARQVSQRGSKGSLVGSGLGLLGAVGLTMLTGGIANPLTLGGIGSAMGTVAGSPLLAGIAGGVGSYFGQSGNLTGTIGAARELQALKGLAAGGGRGASARQIAARAVGDYGGAVSSLDDAALTQGLSRGIQIGSAAGGFDKIGKKGSLLHKWIGK